MTTPNLEHISEKLDEILRRLPVPAATQEQPAGSEAILRCMERHPEGGQCELRRGHARQHLAGMIMWGEYAATLPHFAPTDARANQSERERDCRTGLTRKVGEDGPDLFTPEIQRLLDRREAEMDAFHAGPFAYVCPANCGCMWRDNQDGTMSLFGPRSQSCEACETLPLEKLVPVFAFAMRSSSVPVGEQKQEEGV